MPNFEAVKDVIVRTYDCSHSAGMALQTFSLNKPQTIINPKAHFFSIKIFNLFELHNTK